VCVALILASALGAAAEEKEPRIKGRPLSRWLKQLTGSNRGLQVRAARALSKAPAELHEKIVPKLIPVLRSERENDKFVAAKVLGDYGPAARSAVPDLLPMLKGTQHERNRAAAAKALGQILKDAKPDDEVEKVTQALTSKFNEEYDQYSDVRREAVRALGMIGPAAKSCIPKLTRALTDFAKHSEQHQMVRQQAAWTCGRMGPLAAKHIDRLITMMHSEGHQLPEIVEAIGNIGPVHENVVSNILDKMESHTSWQKASWVALRKFGKRSAEVVPFAKRFLKNPRFYGTRNSEYRESVVVEVLKLLRVVGPSAATCLPEVENLANYKYPFNEDDAMTPVMRKEAAKTAAILKKLTPEGSGKK
jgi:HEAT repeat protein